MCVSERRLQSENKSTLGVGIMSTGKKMSRMSLRGGKRQNSQTAAPRSHLSDDAGETLSINALKKYSISQHQGEENYYRIIGRLKMFKTP